MKPKINKLNGYSLAARRMMRLLTVFSLILLISACASTGGGKQKVLKPVKQSCSGQNQVAGVNAQSGKGAEVEQQNCLPRGVIEITEKFGVDPEVRGEFNRAVDLLQQENYVDAIRLLKAVTGKTSKFSAPYINLGIAYTKINDLEKAEESFKNAIEISDQHPVAHNELGLVYRKTGRYQEARSLYETLLAMYPDFLPARKNLGVLCDIYIQDLNCALEQYEEYLEAIPEDEKVKIWVADVKRRM